MKQILDPRNITEVDCKDENLTGLAHILRCKSQEIGREKVNYINFNRVRACVRACMHVCMYVRTYVFFQPLRRTEILSIKYLAMSSHLYGGKWGVYLEGPFCVRAYMYICMYICLSRSLRNHCEVTCNGRWVNVLNSKHISDAWTAQKKKKW